MYFCGQNKLQPMADKATTTITTYDPNTPVAVSSELYNISKYRWHLNTLGYRTLFCIAQNIDRKGSATSLQIKKEAMFEYLGLTTTNRKYELLNETLNLVRKAGFESCSTNNRGKRKWEGHSWITDFSFGEEGDYVNIIINSFARPFLVELKQFALIQPKTYLRLSTDYQNWFYPLLKLRLGAQDGRWELTIDNLAEQLSLDNIASYSKDNKDRVGNILKKVVGIQPSERFKEEQKLAKAEHRQPKFMAWDWIKGKDGQPTGTLYTINKETDIEVVAQAIKEGRSYSKIILYIREKEECKSAKRKDAEYAEILNAAENDMGKRKQDVPPVHYHTTEELQTLVGVQPEWKTIHDVAKHMGLVLYKENIWITNP